MPKDKNTTISQRGRRTSLDLYEDSSQLFKKELKNITIKLIKGENDNGY